MPTAIPRLGFPVVAVTRAGAMRVEADNNPLLSFPRELTNPASAIELAVMHHMQKMARSRECLVGACMRDSIRSFIIHCIVNNINFV